MRRIGWGLLVLLGAILAWAVASIRIVDPAPRSPQKLVEARQEMVAVSAPPGQSGRYAAQANLPPSAGVPIERLPVLGVTRAQIHDSWGDSRANGARLHTGTDIMAPGGTPVVAAARGFVEKLFYSHGGGGITLYVRSPDRRWSYYYAHLAGYAPGLREGMAVRAGDLLGYVGDTGNAGTGNFHLHFGISYMNPADGWSKGTPVNPYPLLAATRRGG